MVNANGNRWYFRPWWIVVFGAYCSLLFYYALTRAFTWDESYHLLASQLILAGRTPYLDFCFPQSPLDAYWNAFWMHWFGPTWQVAHGVAAAVTLAGVALIAGYAFRSFPDPSWRPVAAVTAGLVTGLNAMVFRYAPLAPYGICLFCLIAAFRLALRAVDRPGPAFALATGVLAASAAASSLLTAAAVPMIFAWLFVYNGAGIRWRKLAAFAVGAAVPFTPVIWLYYRGPVQTRFNLIEYHALFRTLYWVDATGHDIEVLSGWLDSVQGVVLALLAVSGLLYVSRASGWSRAVRAQYYLCAWLACGLMLEDGLAHPTFQQYFLLAVPFLAVLALPGLYCIATRVLGPGRALSPALVVILLMLVGLGKSLYGRMDAYTWGDYAELAHKVDDVTPRGALLYANEPIYFLTRRLPPPGLELAYTHKVNLPAEKRKLLHLLTEDEVKQWVLSGAFATAYSCDSEEIVEYHLHTQYRQRADIEGCSVFWDRPR